MPLICIRERIDWMVLDYSFIILHTLCESFPATKSDRNHKQICCSYVCNGISQKMEQSSCTTIPSMTMDTVALFKYVQRLLDQLTMVSCVLFLTWYLRTLLLKPKFTICSASRTSLLVLSSLVALQKLWQLERLSINKKSLQHVSFSQLLHKSLFGLQLTPKIYSPPFDSA